MGSRGRSRAERQGAQSGAGTGRAVLEDSGSDASRHAYPLHSTLEAAHCARSWLWTVARRSIVGRPGKIKAIEELGSGNRRGRQKKIFEVQVAGMKGIKQMALQKTPG